MSSFTVNLSLGDKRYDYLCNLIKESYPNSCILWIDEVKNDELLAKYEQCKEDIMLKRNVDNIDEKQVFHGTKESNINTILYNGFDVTKNRVSAYGKGTYFAKRADYSKNYTDVSQDELSFMFICKILVGNCIIGTSGMKIDTEKYDCAVDNIKSPNIYVIPYDNGAYPNYIICFHKNAK
jgi:poly [ADP-ribose] polymerase 7/11/12/13